MEQFWLGFVRALYVLFVVANKNAVKRSPAMKRSIRSAKAKRPGVLRANLDLLHRFILALFTATN